jgi:hypothetical protein
VNDLLQRLSDARLANAALGRADLAELLDQAVRELERLERLRSAMPWDRTPGLPPVPVSQERYDGLCARNGRLRDERARLRAAEAAARLEAERHRREIERMAEERHLLHSSFGKGDRFWGCSRGPCKAASQYLRGNGEGGAAC